MTAVTKNALWSGTLTFGLVSIPVAVIAAVHSRRSPFHLIHRTDHSRLRRKLFCPRENVFVHPEHIQRGFEIEPGKYVVIRDEEIESIAPERSRTIEIQKFMDCSQIQPDYYARPYYLVPKGSEKPYQLLVEVLGELHKAGIAEFVMHAGEYLCAVESVDQALCLFKLRYPETLRTVEDLAGTAAAKSDQVHAIESAIKKHTQKFDPKQLRDEYQERVDSLIRKKSRQKTVEVYEEEEEPAEAAAEEEDLAAALEESLAREKKRTS